jgi:hypothetical protein
MITDARIRLEGKLEELERTITVLEGALPAVKNGNWPAARAALDTVATPDVRGALQAARAMAKNEPELDGMLRRIDGVRIALVDTIHAAARSRALPSMTVRQELERLVADEVVYEARLRNPPVAVYFPLGFFFMVTVFATKAAPGAVLPLLAVFGLIAIGLVPFAISTTVLITKEALIIDGKPIRIAEIRRVELQSVNPRLARPYVLRVERVDGVREVRLPEVPWELDAALRRLGIATERTGIWW